MLKISVILLLVMNTTMGNLEAHQVNQVSQETPVKFNLRRFFTKDDGEIDYQGSPQRRSRRRRPVSRIAGAQLDCIWSWIMASWQSCIGGVIREERALEYICWQVWRMPISTRI